MQQGTPAGGQFGNAHNVDRPEDRRGMVQALQPGGHQFRGAHHRGRQCFENRLFENRDRFLTGVVRGPCLKVDSGAPGLAQSFGGRVRHAGKGLDLVEFSKCRFGENALDRDPQGLIVNRPRQAAGQSGRQLLEGHHLQAVPLLAGSREPNLVHPETAMGNYGPAVHSFHNFLTRINLHFSPRGEAKCERGPSGLGASRAEEKGASRLARAGVLEPVR